MSYCLGWDYDDGDDYYEHPEVEKLEKRIDGAKDWFAEIVDILYGNKKFDLDRLDESLDELGSYLGHDFTETTLKIRGV
jgi:hypothetical protein